MKPRWAKRILWMAGGVLLLLCLFAAFPWGPMVALGVRPLSAALGREVTIGHARRIDWFSFVPTVELTDVTIAQPAWAGPGAMARIASVRVRAPLLPLLLGHFRPHALDVTGLRLELRRDAAGRANWEGEKKPGGGGHARMRLAHLTIADGRLHLIDAKRHVDLVASLSSDPAHGLVVGGSGTHRGMPLRLALRGAALGDADPTEPWPVRLAVRSPLATLQVAGRLDRPLDLSGLTARVSASGRDLRFLDDYLQAGLFATAPFAVTGALRRDGETWRIDRLAGGIGRTRLVANLRVSRDGVRTKVTGRIAAKTLDFGDFASAADRARGAARERAIGPRVIPATRIALDKMARLDANLRIDAEQLLSTGKSPFRTLHGDVVLDHRRLTLAPMEVGLVAGRMTGSATVDHRGTAPQLALDLRVTGATIEALFLPDGAVRGPFSARLRLTGTGDTVRAAMARASGGVGFSVPSGTIRRDYATYLGGDVLGSVGVAVSGGEQRVALRCLVGRFAARGGVLSPDPLVLDDTTSRGDGKGRITLADERIDLTLEGRSKHPGPLVSTAPALISGTLSAPKIDVRPPQPPGADKRGTIDRIGFFLKHLKTRGDVAGRAVATDADCAALTAQALR